MLIFILHMIIFWSLCRTLIQTQVPRPPISNSRKNSPMMDRKSVGAPLQTRLRRYTNAGMSSSTDKLLSKRNSSLGAVANPDFESSGMFLPGMLSHLVCILMEGNIVSDHFICCFYGFLQGTLFSSRYISPFFVLLLQATEGWQLVPGPQRPGGNIG